MNPGGLHDFGKSRVCCHERHPDNMVPFLRAERTVVPAEWSRVSAVSTSRPEDCGSSVGKGACQS